MKQRILQEIKYYENLLKEIKNTKYEKLHTYPIEQQLKELYSKKLYLEG